MPSNTSLRTCSKCVMPETHESIVFDEDGVCNVCRQVEHKQAAIDWKTKAAEFSQLIEGYRGKHDYDCIVPFSGGKDSTFALYELITKHRLKPLVVSFDHSFLRPNMLANVDRTLKKLGADYLKFRPNWHVVRKVMLEALLRKGDFCWHCHTGIFAYPMQIAVKFRIPLVVWGEPSAEYTSYYTYEDQEEVDERRFNRFVNLGINAEDMQGMLDGSITMRDLEPFAYPPLKELMALNVRSVCLGSYQPWDVKRQVEIIKAELGWKEDAVEGIPGSYGYEKIECMMQGVRDYLKFLKRGFGRMTHLASIDIRNGRMTRDEALKLVAEFDGKRPASLDVFLDYLGIDEAEFLRMAIKNAVAPHKPDLPAIPRGAPLPDQPLWDRTPPLNKPA